MPFQSAIMANSGFVSASSLVTSAFTLSGNNRKMLIGVGLKTASDNPVLSIVRGSDTFQLVYSSPINSGDLQLHVWESTGQPDIASLAATINITNAVVAWCAGIMIFDDVDDAENAAENSDHTGGIFNPMDVTSGGVNDLVCDFVLGRNQWSGSLPNGSQTDRGYTDTGGSTDSHVSLLMSTVAGVDGPVSIGWNNNPSNFFTEIGVNLPEATATPPVVTVPASDLIARKNTLQPLTNRVGVTGPATRMKFKMRTA